MDGSDGPRAYAVLFFDAEDPTRIVGGTLYRKAPGSTADSRRVIEGSLVPELDTPAPGDFDLAFVDDSSSYTLGAIAIDLLADATIDTRGVATQLGGSPGTYTIEGTGNAIFVIPDP